MARQYASAGKGLQSHASPLSLAEQLREVEEAHQAGALDAGPHLEAIRRRIVAMERKLFPAPILEVHILTIVAGGVVGVVAGAAIAGVTA